MVGVPGFVLREGDIFKFHNGSFYLTRYASLQLTGDSQVCTYTLSIQDILLGQAYRAAGIVNACS